MPSSLRTTFLIVDGAMLAYWSVSALALIGVVTLPASVMYNGYGTAVIDAWNWSFAPLDVLFSLVGLAAVRRARQGREWTGLAIVSLALTGCAGLMAVSFWAIRSEYDPAWWLPNVALIAIALWWLRLLLQART